MKKLSLIALLLALILCLGACSSEKPEADDEDEKIEENKKGEEKEEDGEKVEAKTETATLNAFNSDFRGDGAFTKNSDGTFSIRGSYPMTWTEDELEEAGVTAKELKYDYVFEYRGNWTEKDGKIICRGDSGYFTVSTTDKYKDTLKELARAIEDERADELVESIETGELIKGGVEFSYIYEFEIEKVGGKYRMVAGRDYEIDEPTDLWASYEYEDGELYSATYYYAFGGIDAIHYYENEKLHHIDNYDVDGNKTSTTYPDEEE